MNPSNFVDYISGEIRNLWNFCSYENILIINSMLSSVWIAIALYTPDRITNLHQLHVTPEEMLVGMLVFLLYSLSTLFSIHRSLFLSMLNYLLIAVVWLCIGISLSYDPKVYIDSLVFYYLISSGGVWGFLRSLHHCTRF